MNLKNLLTAFFSIFVFSQIVLCQCPKNPDALYEREKILTIFEDTLKNSIPIYGRTFYTGYFIYDLTDPSNKYVPKHLAQAESCINFIDNHIYHFSPVVYEDSLSHIAVLENGRLEIFKSINCLNGNNTLSEVIKYVEKKLKADKNSGEVLTRLKNYRRYGYYRTIDGYRVSCNWDKEIPENSDKLYDQGKVLGQLSDILRNSVSEKVKNEWFSWWFSVEESRANGFFVYDLTEPINKQTSLLERVELKNNHVYHFAFIDAPFSFSNIAILEDGKLKIFKAINCKGKDDSLQDVTAYLNEKLKNDKNKDEIIKRVKNYRSYGVYASFNGLSAPQCEEALSATKQLLPIPSLEHLLTGAIKSVTHY